MNQWYALHGAHEAQDRALTVLPSPQSQEMHFTVLS